LPCFFISEALERDKIKYYTLLNNIRINMDWNEWIKFFLATVTKQCEKYIQIIMDINEFNTVDIINALYQYPVTNAKQIANVTGIPMTSVNRYLGQLIDNKILFTDNKSRNRTFYYFDLLEILRA